MANAVVLPPAPPGFARGARPLDPALRDRLRELIDRVGLRGASDELGIPRATVASAAAGGGVREGSRVLFEMRLAALRTAR